MNTTCAVPLATSERWVLPYNICGEVSAAHL